MTPPAPSAAPAPSVAPAPAAPSSSAAPSLDELASVPAGACVRKPPGRGIPRVVAPSPDGSPVPLIRDLLAKQARGAVDACLADARARAPGLAGRLVTTLALAGEGGISRAEIEAGAGDAALHRCVTDALVKTPMPSFTSGGSMVLSHHVIALCPDGTTAWPTSQGWH